MRIESEVDVEKNIELMGARIKRRKALSFTGRRLRRSAMPMMQDNPTKEMDAVMLGDALVGYGNNMSLNNMAIMENVMSVAIMEANDLVPGGKNTFEWYKEFVTCLQDLGCFVADDGYSRYSESALQVDMDMVISDIVKGVINGVKSSFPAATVLDTVVTTTMEGLKQDNETLNLFGTQAKSADGARLSVIPCEQLSNGILIASSSSVKQTGSSNNGGVFFVNWRASAREIFRGKSFVTFNPARYEDVRQLIEEYLGEHRKEVLSKRFSRRKRA